VEAEEKGVSFRDLFRDLLLVVARRRGLIAAVYAAVVISALAGAFLVAPEYRAAAKILFTSDRAQLSTSSDRTTELMRTSMVSEAEMNSQLQIIRGRELVEQVLRDMADPEAVPDTEPRDLGSFGRLFGLLRSGYRRLHHLEEIEANDPYYWTARRVMSGLGAARLGGSNIIEVAYVGLDPRWARDFVARLTQAYVDRHASLQRIMAAEDFFTQQSRILQEKLAKSEADLQALRRQIGAQAGQQEEISRQLNEFSAELARTKISREEQERRVAYLERLRANAGASPERSRVATPELLALEARRVELLGRYRPDSERMRDIDEQIRRLRGAIAGYDTITAGAEGGETDLVAARASLAALRGREQALAREREEYHQQAVRLEAQSFDLARLERQVRLDEEAYLSYVRTAEQSRLSNALEQSKLLRLTIIEPAEVPMEPVSPRKGRVLMFALVGGLVVAFGAGVARDHFDATLKTAADVRRYAGLEVLAVLPDRG
jgi:uncharacterized protein involved in exopolysaccharide biosynthesis